MRLAKIEAELLTGAAADIAMAFVDEPLEPVRVPDVANFGAGPGAELARRYRLHGYALFELTNEPMSVDAHLLTANALNLGEPFVPPLYKLGDRTPPPVSVISAADNKGTDDESHPSFGATVGQELHCDGTLQPMGLIKATVMSCRTPAARGGVNNLFDSVAAYAELLRTDLDAALALTRPDVLVRRANINGCDEEKVGPAFAVIEGRLIGHYCVTATDSMPADGEAGDDLQRGIAFLAEAAQPGQPYFRTVRLGAGQGIVFDNTRISHGRTPYEDSGASKRCLFRTLHVRHPMPDGAGHPTRQAS